MVILLISELDPKFTICEKKRKGGLYNLTPPPLVDTSRRFYPELKKKKKLVHVRMDVLVHARVHVEYQNYSCSSKLQQYHCDCYRCKGSGGLLGLRRYLWIPGYKKRDTICCSNCSGKCYSYSSGARYATSGSYEVLVSESHLPRSGATEPEDRSTILLLMSSPSVPSLLNIPTILYPIPGWIMKYFVLRCR